MMIDKILKRKPFTSVCFDCDNETIEADVYPFEKAELPALLEMEEDATALIDDTFFQRNGYFWICCNQSYGWFGLHTID